MHNIGQGIVTLSGYNEEYIVTFPNGYGRLVKSGRIEHDSSSLLEVKLYKNSERMLGIIIVSLVE